MLVAKLNTGKIVRILKPAQTVWFDKRKNVLVSPNLTERPGRSGDVYWVPDTFIVWRIEFS
jgi:hypothetical protein